MRKNSELHLRYLLDEIQIRVDDKYRRGYKEHGGYLPDKPDLLDEAINEAVDMLVYLLTLKKQEDEKKRGRDHTSKKAPKKTKN